MPAKLLSFGEYDRDGQVPRCHIIFHTRAGIYFGDTQYQLKNRLARRRWSQAPGLFHRQNGTSETKLRHLDDKQSPCSQARLTRRDALVGHATGSLETMSGKKHGTLPCSFFEAAAFFPARFSKAAAGAAQAPDEQTHPHFHQQSSWLNL